MESPDEALDRLTRLQTVTASLSEALTAQQVAEVILSQAGPVLGAEAGVVYVLTDNGREFEALRMFGFAPDIVAEWSRFPADSPTPVATAVRQGRPVVVATLEEMVDRFPVATRVPTLQGAEAAVAFPLLVRGRAIGGVGLRFPTEQAFSEQDLAFLETLAGLCAQALDRARLFDAERAARERAERAGEALRESEQRLRTLSDNLPQGAVYQVLGDAQGGRRFLYISAGVERLFGVTPTEAMADSASLYNLVHEEDRPRLAAAEEASRRDLAPFDCEFRAWARTGELRWVRCRSAPRPLPSGQTVWDGIIQDVTDRVRAVELLRRRAEESEKLMDLLPLGLFIAHDAECRRITGNRAGYELLRLPVGSNVSVTQPPGEEPPFVARRDGKLLAPEDLPLRYSAAHGVEVRDAEVEIVHRDGTTNTLFGSASPLFDAQGRVRGCVGSFLDITDRKRLEAELRQRAEQLVEADRRKDEFLAMLAHELRNPLAPIRNAAHVLHMTGISDARVQNATAMIQRQVRHLARLVDDLLDVSRITRGKITLHKEPVDLAAVVAQVVETSRPFLDSRQHELKVSLPAEGVSVEADVTRLAQILGNLLTNAAKFTAESGHISLTVGAEADEAVIRVQDDGMGIAAELLPRVFDLFTQGDRSLARSDGGLGIGLTLVKSLVELHGGSVEAHSEGLGEGSEFVVRLPMLPPPASQPADAVESQHSSQGPPHPCRVLVVDDNKDAAESLAMLLRVAGHEVRTAHDGLTALKMTKTFRPEVILLDIGMPGMDGYEVARRFREQPELKGSLLAALTGYGQEEDRRHSHDAGFDEHLVKPVEPVALERLLAGRAEA
jgi:PAS domain S-box-containing protein